MTIFNFVPRSAQTAEVDPGHLLPEPAGSILVRLDELAERSESHSQAIRRVENGLHDLLGAVQALAARMDAKDTNR
jgi:hypothetical protein